MSNRLDEALEAMDKDSRLEAPVVEETPSEEVEAPVEEEVAPEAPEPTEEPEEEIPLLAGKYKTPQELEHAYQELQSLEGRRSQELGDLRKIVEERLPEKEEDSFDFNQESVDWFDEQVEQNPYGAAEYARQNDPTGRLFSRALQSWAETPGQQLAAMNYLTDLKLEQARAEFAQQTQPLQQQAEQQTVHQAWTQAASEIPDLASFAEQIVEEAKDSPEILRSATTLEEKTRAIHKLYRLAKGAQATSLESATTENSVAEKESARAAKLDGRAASQTKAVVTEPQKSDGDEWLDSLGWDQHAARFGVAE